IVAMADFAKENWLHPAAGWADSHIYLGADIGGQAPASTNTSGDTVTFPSPHGWLSGREVRVSATGGGLLVGGTYDGGGKYIASTRYWVHVVNSTTVSFHTSKADALSGANKVDLTGSIAAIIYPVIFWHAFDTGATPISFGAWYYTNNAINIEVAAWLVTG